MIDIELQPIADMPSQEGTAQQEQTAQQPSSIARRFLVIFLALTAVVFLIAIAPIYNSLNNGSSNSTVVPVFTTHSSEVSEADNVHIELANRDLRLSIVERVDDERYFMQQRTLPICSHALYCSIYAHFSDVEAIQEFQAFCEASEECYYRYMSPAVVSAMMSKSSYTTFSRDFHGQVHVAPVQFADKIAVDLVQAYKGNAEEISDPATVQTTSRSTDEHNTSVVATMWLPMSPLKEEELRNEVIGCEGCETTTSECLVTVESDEIRATVIVHRIPQTSLQCVAFALASLPETRWVFFPPKLELHNHLSTLSSSVIDPQLADFHRQGIDGTTSIVGCADTGINLGNCMLHDSNNPDPFKYEANPSEEISGLPHRKVAAYMKSSPETDYTDEEDGHGTHVVTTILGSIEGDKNGHFGGNATKKSMLSRHAGIAPGARVSFVDMAKTDGYGLHTPPRVSTMYDMMQDSGARIASNSWGTPYIGPTQLTSELDQWAYVNNRTLLIFSAGNYGNGGWKTVTDPALGKNILAVGATQESSRSKLMACIQRTKGDVESCSALLKTDVDDLSTSDILVDGEEEVAYFSSKGPVCSKAMYYFGYTCSTFSGRLKPDVVAPGTSILSGYSAPSNDESGSENSGSSASNYYCGAKTGKQNSTLTVKSGTSMSAPYVAGLAAIVRSYFLRGYYPTGKAVATDQREVSAPLLRGLITHNARTESVRSPVANTNYYDASTLSALDTYSMGFGRTAPLSYLPLEDSSAASTVSLHIFDDQRLQKTDETVRYCFRVPATENPGAVSLNATMVYLDPPTSENSADHLINNLDLIVGAAYTENSSSPGFIRVIVGNENITIPYGTTDWMNTVESVENVVSVARETVFVVDVRAASIPSRYGQPFALVVTTEKNAVQLSSEECTSIGPMCPFQCSQRGTCTSAGKCVCEEGFMGDGCEHEIEKYAVVEDELPESVTYKSITPLQTKYYHFDIPSHLQGQKNFVFSTGVRLLNDQLPTSLSTWKIEILVRRNRFPTDNVYDIRSVSYARYTSVDISKSLGGWKGGVYVTVRFYSLTPGEISVQMAAPNPCCVGDDSSLCTRICQCSYGNIGMCRYRGSDYSSTCKCSGLTAPENTVIRVFRVSVDFEVQNATSTFSSPDDGESMATRITSMFHSALSGLTGYRRTSADPVLTRDVPSFVGSAVKNASQWNMAFQVGFPVETLNRTANNEGVPTTDWMNNLRDRLHGIPDRAVDASQQQPQPSIVSMTDPDVERVENPTSIELTGGAAHLAAAWSTLLAMAAIVCVNVVFGQYF